jgi:hypothetical protein
LLADDSNIKREDVREGEGKTIIVSMFNFALTLINSHSDGGELFSLNPFQWPPLVMLVVVLKRNIK